jgi:hypothetical protein
MRALVVDIGRTHVKMLGTGQRAAREFPPGPTLIPERMVDGVKTVGVESAYDASIRYPGPVLHGRPVVEPPHLGPGWVGFQRGAELWKVLAQRINPGLESRSKLALTLDGSTNALIRRYRMQTRDGR